MTGLGWLRVFEVMISDLVITGRGADVRVRVDGNVFFLEPRVAHFRTEPRFVLLLM
jgi:hypothetical protein